jgi:hypothetical protein
MKPKCFSNITGLENSEKLNTTKYNFIRKWVLPLKLDMLSYLINQRYLITKKSNRISIKKFN